MTRASLETLVLSILIVAMSVVDGVEFFTELSEKFLSLQLEMNIDAETIANPMYLDKLLSFRIILLVFELCAGHFCALLKYDLSIQTANVS